MKHSITRYIVFFAYVLLSPSPFIHADSASWLSLAADNNWNNDDNWTNPFPNGIGETAAFAGYGTNVISASSITIGKLLLDTPNAQSIAFPSPFTLTFDNSSATHQQSNILIASSQTHSLDTPTILNSDLTIQAGTGSSLLVNETISGTGSVSIIVDPSTHISYNSANSYTGDTLIQSGFLDLNGDPSIPDLSAQNIPGNITIFGSGNLKHAASTLNNYAPGIIMTVQGGIVEMNNTSQTIGSLFMSKGANIFSTMAPSSLTLTNFFPPNPTIAMSGDSTIQINSIVLPSGALITNDSGNPGAGIFNGFNAPAGFTTINLSGGPTIINAANNAQEGINEFDIEFANIQFSNGSLVKVGDGGIILDGPLSALVDLSIIQGAVQMGRSGLPATIDGPATITITNPGSTFQGFGTLGTVANNITIVNDSGIMILGNLLLAFPFPISTITLEGNYEQHAAGSFVAQGMNALATSLLTVNTGSVTLDGTLVFFTQPGGTYVAGDEVVIIDNTGGTGIIGTFANFLAEVPSGLSASVIYSDTQVRIRFEACSPSTTILPPTNIQGIQIQDRFAVQRDLINLITWDPSLSTNVVGYRIYRNALPIAVTSAFGIHQFADHNREACKEYQYSVTAIGQESSPTTIITVP